MTLLLAAVASAATLSSTFATDAGGWTGGTLANGALSVTDGAVALDVGEMRSFTLSLRVRLADGDRLTVRAGDAALVADFAEPGTLAFGADTLPLPVADRAWNPDATAALDGGSPSVARWAGALWMARESGGRVALATSADGTTWTDLGAALDGAAPDLIEDAGALAVYTACDRGDGTLGVCRSTTDDGVAFVTDVVLEGVDGAFDEGDLGEPAVARGADGTWHLWYRVEATGAVGHATSADGVAWARAGQVADGTRLGALDAVETPWGWEAAWEAGDGVRHTRGGADPTFADAGEDRGPLLAPGPAAWCPDLPRAPAALLDGGAWHLWVEGEQAGAPVVGHARGVPTPGRWVGVAIAWDGTTATATWDDGPTTTAILTGATRFEVEASGTAELDEALLVWAPPPGDTGDTGAPGDTADTGAADTATDTGAPDTGAPDTADTATPDTASDTAAPGRNASDLAGEPGGCGCATGGDAGAYAAALGLAALVALRRRDRVATPLNFGPRRPMERP